MNSSEILNGSTVNPTPSIEQKFKAPDGTIDIQAAQLHLHDLQSRGDSLTLEEIREAITLVRILRRTNTGPAAAKKSKGKSTIVTEPDDLLNL